MKDQMRAVLFLLLTLCSGAGASSWRALTPQGTWETVRSLRPPANCPPLRLPKAWRIHSRVYADVTGDQQPECLLALWRPWRDWPIQRWSRKPSPIKHNRDAQGLSAHVAVLRPVGEAGRYREVWVGSALFQPIIALTVLPNGTLVTLETSYRRGRHSTSTHLSEWQWTGFGFRLLRRVPAQATALSVDRRGWPTVR